MTWIGDLASRARLERGPSLGERSTHEVIVAEREQIERDEMGRVCFGQHPDAAVGGMDPLLEGLELEPAHLGVGHHDLAVDDGLPGRFALIASTTSGKYRVIGRSLRLPISTSSWSRKTIDRNPSHLGSYENGPVGMSLTDFASMGATGGMTGRRTTYLPDLRTPRPVARRRAVLRGQGHAHAFDRGGARDRDPGELRSGRRVQTSTRSSNATYRRSPSDESPSPETSSVSSCEPPRTCPCRSA